MTIQARLTDRTHKTFECVDKMNVLPEAIVLANASGHPIAFLPFANLLYLHVPDNETEIVQVEGVVVP